MSELYEDCDAQVDEAKGSVADSTSQSQKRIYLKVGIWAGICAMTALTMVLVISAIFPGPKAMTKRLMRAIENGNADVIAGAYPDYAWDNADEKKEYISDLSGRLDDLEIGKMKHKIKDVSDLDDEEREAMDARFEIVESINGKINAHDITDYKMVEVEIINEINGEDHEETWKIMYIKYKGEWKVLYGLPF